MDRVADPVRDLVAVDRGLVGQVDDRFQGDVGAGQPASELVDQDRADAVDPGCPRTTSCVVLGAT
jgi:hypothetical protein